MFLMSFCRGFSIFQKGFLASFAWPIDLLLCFGSIPFFDVSAVFLCVWVLFSVAVGFNDACLKPGEKHRSMRAENHLKPSEDQ